MPSKQCAHFFSIYLRYQCYVGCAIFAVIAFYKVAYTIVITMPEALMAVIMLKIILLVSSSVMLLVGTYKRVRVFFYLFVIFDILVMAAGSVGWLVVELKYDFGIAINVWAIVVMVLEHIFYIYMLVVAVLYLDRLKRELHSILQDQLSRSTVLGHRMLATTTAVGV